MCYQLLTSHAEIIVSSKPIPWESLHPGYDEIVRAFPSIRHVTRTYLVIAMHRFRFDVLCRALCVVAFLWSGTSTGQAEEMISIVTGPPSNRVDMVFLGDGYQEHELPLYETHIGSMVEYMFTQEPFNRYENFFNQHRINVVSNESGADVPPDDIDVDTALGATYYFDGETERLLYIDALSADQTLLRSIPITNIFAPVIFTAGLFSYFTASDATINLPGAPFLTGSLLLFLALIMIIRVFSRYPDPAADADQPPE